MTRTPDELIAQIVEKAKPVFEAKLDSMRKALHVEPSVIDKWFVNRMNFERLDRIKKLCAEIQVLERRKRKFTIKGSDKRKINNEIGEKWEQVFRQVLDSWPQLYVSPRRESMVCGELDTVALANPVFNMGQREIVLVEAKREEKRAAVCDLGLFFWKMKIMEARKGYFFAVSFRQDDDFRSCWRIALTKFRSYPVLLFDEQDLKGYLSGQFGLGEIIAQKHLEIEEILAGCPSA